MQGFGQLGLGQASVGKTQAGLGALGQQLGQADIQSLLGIGGMQQQLRSRTIGSDQTTTTNGST